MISVKNSGGSSGVKLPELANEGTSDDLMYGKQLINSIGEMVTGSYVIPDQSDANATPDTIFKGYCAYVDHELVEGNYIPSEEKGDSTVPEEYQSYVDVAKTMYGGEYSHIFIAENSDFITVSLMTDQFSIETYNSETSLYTATGVYFCRYRKSSQEWQGVDYTSSVSEGEHYIANIKYCDTVIMYGNTKIYPLGVFNTNDATLTEDKAVKGYTFYARGKKYTGTMESGGGGTSADSVRTETVVALEAVSKGNVLRISSNEIDVEFTNNTAVLPSSLPPGGVFAAAFSPDGTRCVVGHYDSPYMTIYDTTTTPWTKLSNPSTLPNSTVRGVSFNQDGTRCVVVCDSTPHMYIYDTTTTPWTKLSNPDTLPTSYSQGVAFSPDGTRCVVAHYGSPYMTIYDTTTTPWTKLSNPSTLPQDTANAVSFSPDGTRCVVAHRKMYYFEVYDTTTTPWTWLSAPSSIPPDTGKAIAFNPSGTRCVIMHSGSPYMTIYDTTTTPWTKLSNPSTLPSDVGSGVAFSIYGTRCMAVSQSSIRLYDTTTTPWTNLSVPGTVPAGIKNCVAFSPDGINCIVGHGNSTYITIYSLVNGKSVAYNSNNKLSSDINVRYGIATKDAAANEELTAEIILDN